MHRVGSHTGCVQTCRAGDSDTMSAIAISEMMFQNSEENLVKFWKTEVQSSFDLHGSAFLEKSVYIIT